MPDPLVIQLAEDFKRELDGRDETLANTMADAWRDVEVALRADVQALVDELLRIYKAGGVPSEQDLFRLRRYNALLVQVEDVLGDFAVFAGEQIAAESEELAQAGIEAAEALVDAATDGEVAIGSFTRLGVEATENVVAIARAGKPLAELLEMHYPQAANGIARELITGIARGRNGRQIAADVVDKGLSQSLDHMLLVARDQANRAYRTASLMQFRESGLVSGYRRVATRDRRTCMACLVLDGKFYDLDEVMPLHPQDRCAAVPVVVGFRPPTWETGREWFARQPAAVQREMMGAAKYDAWKRGKFQLDDIVSIKENATWGDSAVPASLEELVG